MDKKSNVTVLKEKVSPHGIIQLRSDDILVFRPDIGTFKEYNLQILKDLRTDFLEITDGIPKPYMCDNRFITGVITKEEKEYINAYSGDFATQMALITHSPVMKAILNAYNAVFKQKMKIKLFRTEEDAVEWLLEGKD